VELGPFEKITFLPPDPLIDVSRRSIYQWAEIDGAVLSDRQQGEDDDHWGWSPEPSCYLHHDMARCHPRRDGGIHLQQGGGLYSHQAISKRLGMLDITKKRASTEGYQTQQPDVQFRVWGFWNCPPSPWHSSGATKEAHWRGWVWGYVWEMQPHGGVGREGAACPKGRALPPRYPDNRHLRNRAGVSGPASTC